jgi:hypothetical protein
MDVIPNEPIIKPMFLSFPPRLFINRGKRKKEEKLQKNRKLDAIINEKFLN